MRRFLIVKRSDLEASETNFGPLPFPESTVGQWLDDPLLRRSALEMFQAVTGYGAPFGSSYQDLADQVKRKLVTAFQSGLLVTLVEAQASAAAAAAPVEGAQSGGTAQSPKKVTEEPPKEKPEKHWFRCQLFDEDGEPMRNEPYKLKDSNGAIREKTLDENGMVYIPPSLVPGDCTISFPKIHLNPRKKK